MRLLMERRGDRPADPDALAYWREKLGATEQESGQGAA
jgi:hypothetical protein